MNAEVATDELAACERVIEQGLETFVDVGGALLRIRDGRLYRDDFTTFEEYCLRRWNLTRRSAYRMIDAAEVVSNWSHDTPPPATESQARELVGLEPEVAAEVMETAVLAEGRVTARALRDARADVVGDVIPIRSRHAVIEPAPRPPAPPPETEEQRADRERRALIREGEQAASDIRTAPAAWAIAVVGAIQAGASIDTAPLVDELQRAAHVMKEIR